MSSLKSTLKDIISDFIIPGIIFIAIFVLGMVLWFLKIQFLIDHFDSLKQFILVWILVDAIITIIIYKLVVYGVGIILLASKLFRKK